MRACIGIFPDDSVSMCILTTSRFLLVGVTAPNVARLMVSLVEDCSPNFDARDCDIKLRWAPSSKRMLVSIAVLSDLIVAIAV